MKHDDGVSQQDKQAIFVEDGKQSRVEIRKQRRAARKKKVEDERRKLTDGKFNEALGLECSKDACLTLALFIFSHVFPQSSLGMLIYPAYLTELT